MSNQQRNLHATKDYENYINFVIKSLFYVGLTLYSLSCRKVAEDKKEHPLTEKINEGNKPTSGRASRSKTNQVKPVSQQVKRGRPSKSSSQSSSSDSQSTPKSSPEKKVPMKRTATKRGGAAAVARSSSEDSQSPALKKSRRIITMSPKAKAAAEDASERSERVKHTTK